MTLRLDEKVTYVASYHGFESQSRQCMEENAELSKAVNKLWRATKTGDGKKIAKAEKHVVEEMADVLNMIAQIQELLGISNERLVKVAEMKLDREIERIRKEGGIKVGSWINKKEW